VSPSLSSTVSSMSSPTSTSSSSSSVSLTKQRLEQLNLRNNNNNSNHNNSNTDDEESFLVPRPKPPSTSSHSTGGKSASHGSKPSRYSVPVFSSGSFKNGPEVTQDQVCTIEYVQSKIYKLVSTWLLLHFFYFWAQCYRHFNEQKFTDK
jgi:hypothetical protein